MIAIVVIFFVTAVTVGIIARTGTGPREIASRESSQELLGPGGPDDLTS